MKIERKAVLSECGSYRYRLERRYGRGRRTAAVIMVNPSTADGSIDDQTIRKLNGFAERLDISRVIVGNKFAFRATEISDLASCSDPIGPLNDAHLVSLVQEADLHIVAWGSLGKLPSKLRGRWRAVVDVLLARQRPIYCWGTTLDRQPRHPLTLGYNVPLLQWHPPA